MEEASSGLEDFGKFCQHTSLAVKAQKALRSDCGCSFNCDFKVFVMFVCDTRTIALPYHPKVTWQRQHSISTKDI